MPSIGMGLIQERGVSEDLKNFSTNFTSFEKCMEKSVCKIPFIVGCIIGGIFLITTLWCLIRCLICGYTCCTCCCGGCGGRRTKTTYITPPPAPVISRPPVHNYDEPKYAYFDSSSDDALPHMPSARGVDVKRPVEQESHEMEPVRTSPGPEQRPLRLADTLGVGMHERAPSAASSYYSTATAAFGNGPYANNPVAPPPFQAPFQQGRSSPFQQGRSSPYQQRALAPPQAPYAGGVGGQRNTVQRQYGEDVGLNPYQYHGPRQPEFHVGGRNDANQRRPEEWTVL